MTQSPKAEPEPEPEPASAAFLSAVRSAPTTTITTTTTTPTPTPQTAATTTTPQPAQSPQYNNNVSCDHCRNKKIKCDKVKPTCSKCGKLGIRCNYTPKLKPGPKRRQLFKPGDPKNTESDNKEKITLFSYIPLDLAKQLISNYLTSTGITHDLQLSEEYLIDQINQKKYLVLSGVLSLLTYVNHKYRKFHKPLNEFFEFQFRQVGNQTDALELLQALALSSSLQFSISEPKLSLMRINEATLHLQRFNYHLLDLMPPTPAAVDDNKHKELHNMKRGVYWFIYLVDKYCTFGTGMNSRLKTTTHHVCLPYSGTSFNALKDLIFVKRGDSVDEEVLRFKCKPLSIEEYHFILMDKVEDISIWFKEVNYVNKVTKTDDQIDSKFMKDHLLRQYQTFDSQMQEFQTLYEYNLSDDVLQEKICFGKLYLPINCLRALLRQVMIEYLSNFEDDDKVNELSESLRKELLEIMVSISLKIGLHTVEDYNYDPFVVFLFNIILKILVFHSQQLISKEDSNDTALPIVNFTNLMVSIITKLTYEFQNDLAKKILQDYNSKLEISLIDSFFSMNVGMFNMVSKDKLSYFEDFIISDVMKTS